MAETYAVLKLRQAVRKIWRIYRIFFKLKEFSNKITVVSDNYL